MARITVIMPLYNAEKYLEECLDSVLAQSFTDIEVICVDDASDDGTLNILKKYCSKDSRVKIIINDERVGAAKSRNKAMNDAKGEYLSFLDGDDIFDLDMLKVAYETANNHQADIVEYQYRAVGCEAIHKQATNIHSAAYRERFCTEVFKIAELKPYEFMNCHSGPWNKLYRRKFIEKEQLEFQDLPSCNDVYFVNMALLLADRVIFADDNRVMVYVRQHNTPSRISYSRDPMNAYWADKRIVEALIEKEKMEEIYQHLYYRIFCHLVETLKNIKNPEMAKSFYFFLQKEGVAELRDLGGEYYQRLEQEERNKLEKFEKQDFESEWYKEEGEFLAYLEDKAEVIRQLFEMWKKERKKVGLWGVGRNGKAFLNFCRQQDIWIDAIMDVDRNMWGKSIHGFSAVCDPESTFRNVQIIILTSGNIVDEISEKVQEENSDIRIIDINHYLGR